MGKRKELGSSHIKNELHIFLILLRMRFEFLSNWLPLGQQFIPSNLYKQTNAFDVPFVCNSLSRALFLGISVDYICEMYIYEIRNRTVG